MNIFGDQSIKAGDMVLVVRDCCGAWLGKVFRVESLESIHPDCWLECVACKKQWSNITYATTGTTQRYDLYRAPLWWLKKIEPPADGVHEDEREELHA